MSDSYSSSVSSTYTESRAKYVMGKIYDDFCAIDLRGFDQFEANPNQLKEWKEDLFYIMTKQDLDYFQLKFSHGIPRKTVALEYKVKSDGTIHSDNDSGKINYRQFPANTTVSIVVRRYGNKEVGEYLESKGWGNNGIFVDGSTSNAGSYSKDGYGVNRNKIGQWEQ
ncbi:hypothetical protein [Fluviicola taffensis]|uniref:Bacterial HORMA domain-containing protein n=1 Tax=Fluviicola taffensis (strain DSM 16823 / NCIMB 13979 / RW262) TaxID=755732 RepID=F2IEA6_FLUTR|nr:hypothetical protein [Fluviicola taffensis]AEA42424.1 hypothetical protein Fluta_0417 [Fluviicola taffensis DSM 16823]